MTWQYQAHPLWYEKRCPIIDIHLHGGPYRAFHVHRGDGDGLVAEMDACGVDVGVVSSHCAISSDYVLGNDLTAEWVRQHERRLVGFCVVNPRYGATAVQHEIARCFATGRFKGFKIHPELHGDYPMHS